MFIFTSYLACLLVLHTVSTETVTNGQVMTISAQLDFFAVGRLAPHILRAVFHDCVGGCDGCINREIGANQGLPDETNFIATINVLDQLYDKHWAESGLSRADIYILAAQSAIKNTVENANKICSVEASSSLPSCVPMPMFNFQYGRQDCATSPFTDAIVGLPSGHLDATGNNGTTDGLFGFFDNEFGMSTPETVAIMGAGHTLGASTGFSGWRGFWSGNEAEALKFNNKYFQTLIDPASNWTEIRPEQIPGYSRIDLNGTSPSDRWQWNATVQGDSRPIMLHSDIATLKEIEVPDLAIGKSTLDFDSMLDSIGAKYVNNFAKSNDEFIEVFNTAWVKMVNNGAENLKTVTNNDDL